MSASQMHRRIVRWSMVLLLVLLTASAIPAGNQMTPMEVWEWISRSSNRAQKT